MPDETLVFDLNSSRFLESISNPSPIPTLRWFSGDVRQPEVIFVRASGDGSAPVVETDISVVQLGIGIVTAAADTSATAGPPVNNAHPFTVLMNVAAIDLRLGTGTEITVVLEFKIENANGSVRRYQTPFTIVEPLLDDVVADPVPPDIALSESKAAALYVAKSGVTGQIFIKPNGTKVLVSFDNDNKIQFANI